MDYRVVPLLEVDAEWAAACSSVPSATIRSRAYLFPDPDVRDRLWLAL